MQETFDKIMLHTLYAAPKPKKVTFFDLFSSWWLSSCPFITKLNFCTLLMRSAIFTGFLRCLLFKSFHVQKGPVFFLPWSLLCVLFSCYSQKINWKNETFPGNAWLKTIFFRLKIIEVDRRAVKIQLTQKMSQNFND